MAQTFYSLLDNEGGRVEFVFFIHGLPWAAATHADVATALSNTGNANVQTYRKGMFGVATGQVTTVHTPAYGVQIFDILDADIGAQTIKWDEGKGLDVGSWSVNIACEPIGYTWTHRDGTIWGLEGLDAVPNDTYDTSICTAQLSRDMEYGDTTLYFKNDVGGKLVTKITANVAADDPTYIWVGSEVVMARQTPVDQGGGEYSVLVARRCYKTKKRNFYTEDYEGNNLAISDAPIGGIAGMPATLYAVPMDRDGNILDIADSAGPVRFREGKCMPSSTAQDGVRRVSVHGWKKWLDYDVQANYYKARLGGYTFSHTSATAATDDQAPHIIIREWNGAANQLRDVWLCAAGESVHYDTYQELCEAVTAELMDALDGATANGTEQFHNAFYCDPEFGPTQIAPMITVPLMDGPLPHLLHWGGGGNDILDWTNEHQRLKSSNPYWNLRQKVEDVLNGLTDIVPLVCNYASFSGDFNQNPFNRSDYILQYAWQDDDAADYSDGDPTNGKLANFPVPEETVSSTYRVHISDDYDATDFANGATVMIGVPGALDDYEDELLGKMVVNSTGDNWIDVKGAAGGYVLEEVDGSTYPCIRHHDETPGPFWRGFCFHNAGQLADRWPLQEMLHIEDTNPVNLLRALLGDTTISLNVPGKYEISHVPNAWNDSGDWYDGINWDQLEDLAEGALEGVSARFILSFDKELNFLNIYNELLKTLQISETWEFCEAIRGWQIGFRRTGVINITTASNQGRVVDSGVRAAGHNPIDVTANTWLYGRVDAQFHYDDVEGKFKVHVIADDKTGRALGAGGEKALKIEDRITHIDGAENIADDPVLLQWIQQHFGTLLKKISVAEPEQKVKCTIRALARLAVGRECLVTDATARNPYTWELGITKQPALVTRQTIRVGGRMADVDVAYRFAAKAIRGWAPAMKIDVGGTGVGMSLVGTNVTVTGLATDPANNDFGDPDGGLTDLEYFDCLYWNAAEDTVSAKDCSCGNYAIIVFDADVSEYDTATPNRNHWTGTITTIDGDAGSCVLALDNADDFNVNTDKIVIFNTYDNCEDCQQDYLFFADSGGTLGAASATGGRWA